MSKIVSFFKSTIGKIVIALVLVVVSFLGGMEYKAYQIRKVFNNALGDISKSFGNTQDTSKQNTPPRNPVEDLSNKVKMEITKKGFSTENYQSQNDFTFKFTNNTAKDIEGVQGMITMRDLFGNVIKQVSIAYDKGIKAGESKLYNAGVDYNQFIDDDILLRQTELSKMKYDWRVDTIIYADGSEENQ